MSVEMQPSPTEQQEPTLIGESEQKDYTIEDAATDHHELTYALRDAIVANDLAGIRDASVNLALLERAFPELAPVSSLVTERDN